MVVGASSRTFASITTIFTYFYSRTGPIPYVLRMLSRLLLMSLVVTACRSRPGNETGYATKGTRLEESSRYGDDRAVGLLHVTAREAYLNYSGRRILLIAAPPMTAVSPKELLFRTAGDLQHLSGKQVRAQGDLQGSILWGTRVTLLEGH